MKKLKYALILIPSLLLLTGCDLSEAIPNIDGLLIPSWLSFVVQIFALIVLMLIVIFVAYKPVKDLMKKRSDYIENNIKESEKNLLESQTKLNQANQTILSSKEEASKIVECAAKEGLTVKEEIIDNANKEALKIKQDAEIDIENSKKEALEEIRKEIVDVALTASEEILKREVNRKDNEKITNDFIEKL